MTEARDLEIGTFEHSIEENLIGRLGVPTDHEKQPRLILPGELDRAVRSKRRGH
ncbi:MAG TPA: hypothetical protein VIM30_07385 [Candidatus Limnocylindrales bacterium]|jgi:hypothetical protein